MPAVVTQSWGVLLKVRAGSGGPPPSQVQLDRVLAHLPGDDKRLTGGGVDFTVWSWVEAPDAVAATRLGAATLRSIARDEGLPPLTIVRAHAASVEGRSSAFPGIDARLRLSETWSVYCKAEAPPGTVRADAGLLARFREALDLPDANVTLRGDSEKFLVDDGSGFTARFWVSGKTPAAAFRSARASMLAALERTGIGDWTVVRFQAATAGARRGDAFPGVGTRTVRSTEETR